MTDILSSTPLTPLGILLKSSLPRAFWHTEKVQLSVPVNVRSSLEHFYEKTDVIDEADFDSKHICYIAELKKKVKTSAVHLGT